MLDLGKTEAKLKLEMNDKVQSARINGNGPVDATFNAIKNLTSTDFKLKLYQKCNYSWNNAQGKTVN